MGCLLLLLRFLASCCGTGLPDGTRYKAITVMKKPIAKLAVSASNRVIWMDRPNKPPVDQGVRCAALQTQET